ncbi:injection protein [Escherichia coli]|nr:injection protein [Escherichia coli]MHY01074.1 injection protein [Escherichia coli]
MAKAWKDVIASPQYQALAPEQKAQAQEQYFNEVVAPQAGESVEQAKQAFYAAYPLPSTNEIDRAQSATQNIQHTSSDNSLASGYAKLATQQREGLERSAEQGASLGAAMRDAITGESRMTPEMERLQNVDLAPELTSLSMDALKARWSQLFGSDASQEKILQSMGAKLRQDEKGNTIVSLPSGDYALNKPGLSPQDVASFLANALAFTPAGRAGTVLGAIGKSAATDLALQGATSLAGGEDIDPLQTVISAGIGGIGKGLENTVSAVSRAVRGDMAQEAKAAVDFASERNLPLMTSDVLKDKNTVQSLAQKTGEKIPFFGTGTNRLNQQQARENLVRTYNDGLGGISDKQLYESATKGQQKFIEAAGKRYNRIIDAMGDTPVDLSNTVKAIDNQIAVLSRPGKSQDRAAVKVLQQFKDDITSGPNDLRLARENRTDLRKRFMNSNETVDKDTLQKASDIVYKAYTLDMRRAVAQKLGSEEAANMARVDRSWSKFNDMMGRTRVQKAIASGKATPEDVTKLVFSQSPSERSQLYRLLDDNGRQNARAAIVQNAVDKATDPSGNISVEKFINALHRNRKQSATFFKGVHGKELDGIIKYLNDTRQAAKVDGQKLNSQKLYGLLVGGGAINAAVLAGMLKTAAFVVPAAGALGGAAKAYESPVIRNALLRLANTPKGSTAYDRAISTVTQSLTTAAQASQKEAQ